jgi:hypothetical protein
MKRQAQIAMDKASKSSSFMKQISILEDKVSGLTAKIVHIEDASPFLLVLLNLSVRCCDVRFLAAFLFFLFTPLLVANNFSLQPWPDVNLPVQWHLNSRRVPMPPVPCDGMERVREIHRRRALLPMHLWWDPAFDIRSSAWDTFSWWELRPDRRPGWAPDGAVMMM